MTESELIYMREGVKAVRHLQDEIVRLESLRTSPRVTVYGRRTAPKDLNRDITQEQLERMDGLISKYRAQITEAMSAQERFESAVAGMGSMDKSILRLYYVDGLTWLEVAARTGYSLRQLYRIRDRLLELLEEQTVDLKT